MASPAGLCLGCYISLITKARPCPRLPLRRSLSSLNGQSLAFESSLNGKRLARAAKLPMQQRPASTAFAVQEDDMEDAVPDRPSNLHTSSNQVLGHASDPSTTSGIRRVMDPAPRSGLGREDRVGQTFRASATGPGDRGRMGGGGDRTARVGLGRMGSRHNFPERERDFAGRRFGDGVQGARQGNGGPRMGSANRSGLREDRSTWHDSPRASGNRTASNEGEWRRPGERRQRESNMDRGTQGMSRRRSEAGPSLDGIESRGIMRDRRHRPNDSRPGSNSNTASTAGELLEDEEPILALEDDVQAMLQRKKSWATKSKHSSFRESEVNVDAMPKAQARRRPRRESREEDNFDEDDERKAKQERRAQRKRERDARRTAAAPPKLQLPDYISCANLARALKTRVEDFLKRMSDMGFDDLKNDHILDSETAGLIATEFNYEPVFSKSEDRDLKSRSSLDAVEAVRPPIVTIMGHVDHGKTTMLDTLRQSSIAASEHGGITQHIGAFSVAMSSGRTVTFLDTPGHAAFLAMRQRGANVTDIVILVVAADDSVMPQTIEAIKHAQNAKVPMIVAINKVDKEGADIEKVKQDLARHGVEIEDYGGDTQVVPVSGKTGQGMDILEENIVALADILDLQADFNGGAEGWILEGTTTQGGRVATVLVRRGTLRPGDVVVAGTSWARVRTLRNEAGVSIDAATPGMPVEVDGWRTQPMAGDEMLAAEDEQEAKEAIDFRREEGERAQLADDVAAVNAARRLEQEKREQHEIENPSSSGKRGRQSRSKQSATATSAAAPTSTSPSTATPTAGPIEEKCREIRFIVKADVSGSLEAVSTALLSIPPHQFVRASVHKSSVGPIIPGDIDTAAIIGGHIITFNTSLDAALLRDAEARGVRVIESSIIYRLVDQVRALLEAELPERVSSRVLGEAEILQLFEFNVRGRVRVPVAGCKVRNGVAGKGAKVRVLRGREREVVYDGTLSSLRVVKKDVGEVKQGGECGMAFADWDEFGVGDAVQFYEEIREKRRL